MAAAVAETSSARTMFCLYQLLNNKDGRNFFIKELIFLVNSPVKGPGNLKSFCILGTVSGSGKSVITPANSDPIISKIPESGDNPEGRTAPVECLESKESWNKNSLVEIFFFNNAQF
jgi:hypothetical protein